jgi:O-antigen/teichoic acid export membrane protein
VQSKKLFLIAHIFTFVISLVMALLLPSYLGITSYADVVVWLSLINFLSAIASVSLVPFIIRNYNRLDELTYDLARVTRIVFSLGSLSSFVVVCGLFFFGFFKLSFTQWFLIYSLSLLVAATVISTGYYRAANKYWTYFIVVAGSKILLFVLFVAFYFIENKVSASEYMILYLLSLLFVLILVRFSIFMPSDNSVRKSGGLDNALRFCAPIAFTNIVIMLLPVVERGVIQSKLSELDMGVYVFNFELGLKVTTVILLVLKLMVWPLIANGNPEKERKLYRYWFIKVSVIATLALVVVLSFGEFLYVYIIGMFVGNEFVNVSIFKYALVFSYISVMSYMVNVGVMLAGRTSLMILGAVIFLMSHLIGMTSFIDKYGIESVSISIVISFALSVVVVSILNRKFIYESWIIK